MRRFLLTIGLLLAMSSSANATEWYAGATSSGSNNGTSWANKWALTGVVAASVAAGDTINVDCGTTSQTYTTAWSYSDNGTLGNPIRIRAGQDATHNGICIFEGNNGTTARMSMGGNNYIWIDGEYNGERHFKFQNNSQNSNGTLLTFFGNASTQGLGNRVSYVEGVQAGSGVDYLYQKGSRFDHNWIHNISCDHVLGMAGSAINNNDYNMGVEVDHNVLQANHTPGNATAPDVIQGTHGNTIHDNEIYGASGTLCSSPNHQDGIQQGGSHYTIYNNLFYNLNNSHTDSDWNNSSTCGFMRVWNNVFAQGPQGNPAAIWVGQQTGCNTVSELIIVNNTFVDFPDGPPTIYIQNTSSTPITASRIQNNIFYNTNGIQVDNGTFTCGVGLIVGHNNMNAGVSGNTNYNCSPETGHQAGAPSFMSYSPYAVSTNDFRITSASTPDIQTGTNLTGLSLFTTDKAGIGRPASGAWDIGAYAAPQSQGPPPIPSGLLVQLTKLYDYRLPFLKEEMNDVVYF